jgi:hypothetical protein
MSDDRATDSVEIPPPAAECRVCSREWIALDDLRLVEGASLYLDSHDGAGLERCEVCGAIYRSTSGPGTRSSTTPGATTARCRRRRRKPSSKPSVRHGTRGSGRSGGWSRSGRLSRSRPAAGASPGFGGRRSWAVRATTCETPQGRPVSGCRTRSLPKHPQSVSRAGAGKLPQEVSPLTIGRCEEFRPPGAGYPFTSDRLAAVPPPSPHSRQAGSSRAA